MIPRPRLLDLFCCAGGAAMGYHRAGFDVVGVDAKPQPNYPFPMVVADALAPPFDLSAFDAIHASPPCRPDSAMSNCRPGLADEYERLIEPARDLLRRVGRPYVIENVVGAALIDPVVLCGQMFGLDLYRHRLFECSFPTDLPLHPPHAKPASRAGHWTPGTVMSVAGHVAPIAVAREAMGIDWTTRDELAEAIPPAYTEWIGKQLLAHLTVAAASSGGAPTRPETGGRSDG